MKTTRIILLLLVILTCATTRMISRENIGGSGLRKKQNENVMSGCTAGITQDVMQLNNVRTTILTSGDMWWNLISAKYEVPKGGGASSIFAGSLWIGGLDAGGQLKIAAMTYRQNGVDYWPGPIDTAGGNLTTSSADCQYYDKHYVINLSDVQNFVNGNNPIAPPSIQNWPGNAFFSGENSNAPNGPGTGVPGTYLAPFYDANNDGYYDYNAGDYPKYSLPSRKFGCGVTQLFGDQTMWGVFNDEGNIHTETNGQAIGLEVRYQCFAYTSTDAINNATFYDYQVINRSNVRLSKTYFGVWCDFDLGYAFDDFTGCDVANGIGYGYNGTQVDGGGQAGTYGANPPCVGIDFFRGPKADDSVKTDGVDQSGVSFVDPLTGRIGMAKFVYYNNDFSVQGNPTKAQDYYNYLSGFWIDGTPFTYGGNAYKGSGPVCDFMFPGSSDPSGKGTKNVPQQAWAEYSSPANPSGDVPGDRRFMESAGPFTLLPGAVNSVTTGVVWARTTNGGNLASIPLMQDADVLAQALFNNCFQITSGPDAPDVTVTELNNELIFSLTNGISSNNYKEHYSERDPYMTLNLKDTLYKFQGYQVFQITDSTVSESELNDPSKARLAFCCGLKNGVIQIINYYNNTSLAPVWVPTLEVTSPDSGISHSFVINSDLFSTGTSNTLVNNRQYYYMAIAYGYNPGEAYGDPNNTSSSISADGFKGKDGFNIPYIASRHSGQGTKIRTIVGMPHNPAPENGGTSYNSVYGNGIQMTRIEGQGNGGQVLQLTPQSEAAILASGIYTPLNTNGARVVNVSYLPGNAPVKIVVIDPLTIPPGNFQISISDSSAGARWVLTNMGNGSKIKSDTTVQVGNQQIIPEYGISVTVSHTTDIASLISDAESAPNGVSYSSLSFTDPTQKWLSALADNDAFTTSPGGDMNWIRSGRFSGTTASESPFGDYMPSGNPVDGNQFFEKIIGGTWAPYSMCAYTDNANQYCTGGPAMSVVEPTVSPFYLNSANSFMGRTLASVDIVITSNRANWTRCPVLEMQENAALSMGHATKLGLRHSQSVDQYGNFATGNGPASTSPSDPAYVSRTGMGWFPGYAINIETGERLNMAFGEDSGLPTENGRDMIWNPTSDIFDPAGSYPIFGGKHYIYVFAHVADQTFLATDKYLPNGPKNMPRYDAGLTAWQLLNASAQQVPANPFGNNYSKALFGDAMWVNIPLLAQGEALAPASNPYAFIKTDVKVQIRVPRIYRRGFSGFYGAKNPTDPRVLDTVIAPNKAQNNNWALYSFTTNGLQVETGQNTVAKNALDLINIVPNPYYAYSGYEATQLDNRVRITNLPPTCTVRIFTISGTLVYTFNKADPSTFVDWTLVNQANIPIAGGMYLIHIKAPGIGEKILKWFGVLRPADLNTF